MLAGVESVVSAGWDLRSPLSLSGDFFVSPLFFVSVVLLFLVEVSSLIDGLSFPTEVSVAGTSVAPEGMEFSYSLCSRSIAERIDEFILMPSVLAMVLRSLVMSGIQ